MVGATIHAHYKIVKFLGIGRSGVTYLVKDLDLPDAVLYVFKRIDYGTDRELTASLKQELFEFQCSIAYQVGQHPQIPSLVAKFEENGNRYLVREYIEGELLSRELASGSTWSQTQAFDFLMDLVGILSFIHSCKYIHQDINPQNIIRRNDDGRFSLVGFSLVKDIANRSDLNLDDFIGQSIDDRTKFSSYIPYEQEENLAQFNSDIYAVGAIAIQALTGKSPLDKDPRSYELKWKEDVNINVKLIEIIDKMVRPDYRDRYQSALEVLQDLQSFALTQIPRTRKHRFNPYLIFGTGICTLFLVIWTIKPLLKSTDRSQLSPPIAIPGDRITWKIYLDRTAGIKIKYSDDWYCQEIHNIVTGEKVNFTSSDRNSDRTYRENISIRIENLSNSQTTLASYTKSAIAEINKYDRGAKIIESSPTLFANRPANIVTYLGKDENGILIKSLEIWTIDRGKAYILTYKAESHNYYRFLQKVMMSIDSFELLNSEN